VITVVKLIATRIYRVRLGQPIFLTVEIGDLNPGATARTWRGHVRNPEPVIKREEFEGVSLGQDVDLLKCDTVIRDQHEAHNWTSVTYLLEGGVESERYPFSLSVKEHKGLAQYMIDFLLLPAP